MASGNDLWLDDLANWEANVGQAIKDLPRLEKALREQADVLRKHAARIRLYEQDVSMHEHALADYERGESGEELIQMAQVFGRRRNSMRIKVENMRTRSVSIRSRWPVGDC